MTADTEYIPNSFQTPNVFVDRLMPLLTPEEWVVLTYAARRIFGFNKRQDRISLSQFCDGVKDRNGEQLDHGTGLGRTAVRTALDALERYRVLIKTADNDFRTNLGAQYHLQAAGGLVDWAGLDDRKAKRESADGKRTAAARTRRNLATPSVGQTGVCPTDPICGTDWGCSVGQMGGVLSDRNTKHRETQGNTVSVRPTVTGASETSVPDDVVFVDMNSESSIDPGDLQRDNTAAVTASSTQNAGTDSIAALMTRENYCSIAAQLYHDGGKQAVYCYTGGGLYQDAWEEWKDQLADHLEQGKTITVALLAEVGEQAMAEWKAAGMTGRRTMGWFYTALRNRLHPEAIAPSPTNSKRRQATPGAASNAEPKSARTKPSSLGKHAAGVRWFKQ